MKKISFLLILLILLGIGITTSCEPDDICPESTPTTPSLIIDLYDQVNSENKKAVTKLLIVGVGNDDFLPDYGIVTATQIILPLKTDANSTQYKLYKDYSVNDNGTPDDDSDDFINPTTNLDTITINYSREEVYVSRACGYKTIFKNVTFNVNDDGDKWIKSWEFLNENQSVEDETATHINIFH